jgi:adenylate cyclase
VSKASRLTLSVIGIALAAALIAFFAVRYASLLTNLEYKAADIRIAAMQPPAEPSKDVIVVALDEATLTAFAYRSPVDRGFLADLITQLSAKGAKLIGVDVIVDQPTEPEKDAKLKQVIDSTRTPLFFSYSSAPNIVTEEQLAYLDAFIPADKRAEANLLTDPFDQSVRKINPGGELNAAGQRIDTPHHPAGFVRKTLALAGREAPMAPVEIAWRSRPDAETPAFPTFSAAVVPFLPESFFKDKIVLIGAIVSMTDRHRTPLAVIDDGDQGNMPGIYVQAHGVTQILEGRKPPRMSGPATAAITLIGAILGVLLSLLKRGILFNVAVGALLIAAYWAGAVVGYGYGLPMLPLVGPTMAFAFSIWMMDVFIGRGERKQREFVQGTFSRYVSPAVVNQLVADPSSVSISGVRREATFIFTDVAGFTTLSEQLTSEALSDTLNDYLNGACEIIQKYEGTIDKFIGDAIMSIFNAPILQPDHPERAIKCALELDAYAEAFRIARNAEGIPIGLTRIGIHTGEATIGNFGSQSRMDFTALGDTVNTAARTEGVNKYFGTRICATEQTVSRCPSLRFRPVGDIVLKGKLTATALYRPVADDEPEALTSGYDAAYALLREKDDNPAAVDAFTTLGAEFPDDPLTKFHLKRMSQGIISSRVVMDDK